MVKSTPHEFYKEDLLLAVFKIDLEIIEFNEIESWAYNLGACELAFEIRHHQENCNRDYYEDRVAIVKMVHRSL